MNAFVVAALAGIALVVERDVVLAQSPLATLSIRWTSDSSWEGSYLGKVHRFSVREAVDGRLVVALSDSTRLPRSHQDSAATPASGRKVDVIQLNENGTASGATLVASSGTTAYDVEVTKEGGDCAITDVPDTNGLIRAPFTGREQGREEWGARSPGAALLLLRAGEPVAFAFAPAAIHVESITRLLCPQPEQVRRAETYRVSVRFGDLLRRSREGSRDSSGGTWVLATSRTARGGYAVNGTYDVVVMQHRAIPGDPASASGRLAITKRVTLTWEPGDVTRVASPSP